VAAATDAMAATFETAARGIIYEQRPPSLPAERLTVALKPMFLEAGRGGGSAFERDAAVVLRRLGDVVRDAAVSEPANRRAFLDWLARMSQTWRASGPDSASTEPSPLIVP
jgi:hypothetical protein